MQDRYGNQVPLDAEQGDVGIARELRTAQSMLVALLTVNRRVCHQAASALLHHEWAGQSALLEFFESRTAAMDQESRTQWLRLSPDRRGPLF